MTFTIEHERILKKNRGYYDQLKSNGTLPKISSIIVSEFQTIYSEAIRDYKFSTWCPACIVELIESCYLNYNKFIIDGQTTSSGESEEHAANTRNDKPNVKTKTVSNARNTSAKN